MEGELGAVVAAQIQDSLPFFLSARQPSQKEINLTSFFPFQVMRIIAQNFISFMVSANGFCAGSFSPLSI